MNYKLELNAITNIHIYYQNWAKLSSRNYSEFKNLWELVMIRSTSEAICETVGSIVNQHAGKNRHLEPEYFSMELVLRFSLGPIHLLDDFVDEILSSDTGKTYIFEIGDKTRSSH